jgi:hypothetical protein
LLSNSRVLMLINSATPITNHIQFEKSEPDLFHLV